MNLDYEHSESDGLIAICLCDRHGIFESEYDHYAAFYVFDTKEDREIDLDAYLSKLGLDRRKVLNAFYESSEYVEWKETHEPITYEEKELVGVLCRENEYTIFLDPAAGYGGIYSASFTT